MRHLLATAAAIGLIAIGLAPAGAAEAAQDANAHILIPGASSAAVEPGALPVILRGSAVGPKPAATAQSYQQYQIASGRFLWFFDPVTLDVRSCINRQTSTVGVRIVRCFPGSLSGYRRTFGPTFQP